MNRRILFSLLLGFGAAVTASADMVTDWNERALQAIRTDRTPPPRASRALAIMHVAIYDAVNGIAQTSEPYLMTTKAPGVTSKEAAAAAAAHAVLTALFPAQGTNLDAGLALSVADIPDHPGSSKKLGLAWGRAVAHKVLMSRSNDGSTNVVTYTPGTDPGDWQPTPPLFAPYLLPQWAFVTPFAMTSPQQFRPPGPPALDSARWAADYNEVKALGAAVGSTRTAEQSEIARFWADGGGTETPPGHWNSIAQTISAARGNTLDQNARLFALLNIAMADAAICSWDSKLAFSFWRPVTAIRNGGTDGNDDTVADPTWSSFIPTPPFPDYTSGHSTFSAAAATVLGTFYGTDTIAFTTDSDGLAGVTRSFTRLSDAAREAAESRLYGGIHYRSANEDGLGAGLGIGAFTVQHYLKDRPGKSQRGKF